MNESASPKKRLYPRAIEIIHADGIEREGTVQNFTKIFLQAKCIFKTSPPLAGYIGIEDLPQSDAPLRELVIGQEGFQIIRRTGD